MPVLGNDVVDLVDPETRIDGLHTRFEERVFTSGERAALATSRSPHVLRWALWAGTESAYKALKRLEPELVFAPRELEVQLSPPAVESGGRTAGQVTHRGRTLVLAPAPCVAQRPPPIVLTADPRSRRQNSGGRDEFRRREVGSRTG